MIIFHKPLWAEGVPVFMKQKIKYAIRHNKALANCYYITMSDKPGELMEILPCRSSFLNGKREDISYVIGIAVGKQNAYATASSIVMQMYQETGGFDLDSFLKGKRL